MQCIYDNLRDVYFRIKSAKNTLPILSLVSIVNIGERSEKTIVQAAIIIGYMLKAAPFLKKYPFNRLCFYPNISLT